MTKTFKLTLAQLGDDYRAQTIDFELCGYRRINAELEIEISGMNNNRRVHPRFTVCIWRGTPLKDSSCIWYTQVGEPRVFHDVETLKKFCDNTVKKWSPGGSEYVLR